MGGDGRRRSETCSSEARRDVKKSAAHTIFLSMAAFPLKFWQRLCTEDLDK